MSSVPRSALVRQFRTLFEVGTVAGLTDGQLLERFLDRRDEAGEVAFAALVSRHGPMVLGVCRRALSDPNDAADAFQATFLILVRKARSIRVDDSLGRWLYGVSRRVAARARLEVARRPRTIPDDIPAIPTDPDHFELTALLDEELARLPRAYRLVIVLCDLGGLTHEEAARDLVCPVGTIKSRLARGRRKLRERLERRGLAPSMMILAPPTVPASLAEAAVRMTSMTMTAGQSMAGIVPASAVALAEGVLKSMTGIKLNLAAGSVLLVGMMAVGAAVMGQSQKGDGKSPVEVVPGAVGNESRTESEGFRVESKSAELARQSFPPGHWATDKDVKFTYHDAATGQSIYAQNYQQLDEGKRIAVRPLALVWVSKDGKSRRVVTCDQAEIELSRPLDRVKPEEGTPRIARLRMTGDIRVRDDQGEFEFRANQLDFNPGAFLARDETREPARPEPPAANPGRKTWPGSGLTTEPPRELSKVSMPDYVVEPPDKIDVEVLEALPGRPITGDRLVRPDGKISLGFYGEVYVSGLTTTEIKAKVALHLRQYVDDEKLGLTRKNPQTDQVEKVDPKLTDRVFVDVSSYNSKVYYVQGDVGVPGRLPITGNETVLDAINYAGGLIPTVTKPTIRLVRPFAPGAPGELSLAVDLDAIVSRGDTKTNYQILPGDRLVVISRERRPPTDGEHVVTTRTEPTASDLEARLQTVEQKLDNILKILEKSPKP